MAIQLTLRLGRPRRESGLGALWKMKHENNERRECVELGRAGMRVQLQSRSLFNYDREHGR